MLAPSAHCMAIRFKWTLTKNQYEALAHAFITGPQWMRSIRFCSRPAG